MAFNNNFNQGGYDDNAPPPPPRAPRGNIPSMGAPAFNRPGVPTMAPPTFNRAPAPTMAAPALGPPGDDDTDLENTMASVNDPFWQRRKYTRDDSFPELAGVDFDLPPTRTPLPAPPSPNDFKVQKLANNEFNDSSNMAILASKNFAAKTNNTRLKPQTQPNYNQNQPSFNQNQPNYGPTPTNNYAPNQPNYAQTPTNIYAQQPNYGNQGANYNQPQPTFQPQPSFVPTMPQAVPSNPNSAPKSRHRRKKHQNHGQKVPSQPPGGQTYDPKNNWRTQAAANYPPNTPNYGAPPPNYNQSYVPPTPSSFAQPTPSFTQPNYKPPSNNNNEAQLWDNQPSRGSRQPPASTPSRFPAAPANWGAPSPNSRRDNDQQQPRRDYNNY